MRRLLPILLSGALLGVVTGPAQAQNICSPSTAASTVRYPQYPGSMPYSNTTTNITSNCSGPTVEVPITPDPYANVGFPVPGFQYAPSTVTASAMPSVDPGALYAPTGPAASYAGYAAPGAMGYGAGYSYGADRLFALPYFTALALQTATIIAALSTGLMAAVHEHAPTRWLIDDGATGAVARRGIPLIIAVPFLAGWIRLWGERSGSYDTSFGTALLVVVVVILLLGFLSWTLRTVLRNESALRTSQQQMGATLQSIADG